MAHWEDAGLHATTYVTKDQAETSVLFELISDEWLIGGDEDRSPLVAGVTCPACRRVHFINRSSGEVLGERRPGSQSDAPSRGG
jgi:hypothetical protein